MPSAAAAHDFVLDEDGDVDIFAFNPADPHNGPVCRRCGGWCHHCQPSRASAPCPAGSEDR